MVLFSIIHTLLIIHTLYIIRIIKWTIMYYSVFITKEVATITKEVATITKEVAITNFTFLKLLWKFCWPPSVIDKHCYLIDQKIRILTK